MPENVRSGIFPRTFISEVLMFINVNLTSILTCNLNQNNIFFSQGNGFESVVCEMWILFSGLNKTITSSSVLNVSETNHQAPCRRRVCWCNLWLALSRHTTACLDIQTNCNFEREAKQTSQRYISKLSYALATIFSFSNATKVWSWESRQRLGTEHVTKH